MNTFDESLMDEEQVQTTIKIFARVRPPRKTATQSAQYYIKSDSIPSIGFNIKKNDHTINNQKENYEFKFDRIFDIDVKQEEVFDVVAKDVVQSVLDGYNGTIFAYGIYI